MEATAQRGDEGGGLRGPAAVSRHRPPGVTVAPRPCREHRAGGLETGLSQGCGVQGRIHVKGRAQSKEWDLIRHHNCYYYSTCLFLQFVSVKRE